MILQPGCPLIVAPSFHLPIDWSSRLLLGAGVEREGQGFLPRPPWRHPDSRELAVLAPPPSPSIAPRQCLCLFRLPQHLLSAWWRVLELVGEGEQGRLEGFNAFVAGVADFLAFKDLPVPEGAAFDLVVSKPGLRSTRQGGSAPGLAFNLAAGTPCPVTEESCCARIWGGLNLGDEPTSLLLVNLAAGRMLAELQSRQPQFDSPHTLGELAERFLTFCPDCLPLRLGLEPGEGFRLPDGGLLMDGCTLDKQEPDVRLLIHHAGSAR